MLKSELEYFIDNLFSSYRIAKEKNVSQSTVRHYLKKYGLKTHFKRRALAKDGINSLKYSFLPWEEIQKSINEGLTWKETRKRHQISFNGLSWGIKNKKIRTRSKSDASKLAWVSGKHNPEIYKTEEHRKKMSKFGGLKLNSGRCKKLFFTRKSGEKICIQGSWEMKLVCFLEDKNINWERNHEGFNYIFEGRTRRYYPDFIIKGKYVEVKGYKTELDLSKWKYFPHSLIILEKDGLLDLDKWYLNNFSAP
jgi:predicted transcriptional regulator